MFENNVHLLGRLTADPEVKQTNSGMAVANFTVAINRVVKKDAHPEADFIRCVAWDKTASVVEQYFGKGDRIGVEGRIQTRNYEDKDGNKRNVVEVVADRIAFIEKKGESAAKTVSAPTIDEDYDDDDELPV